MEIKIKWLGHACFRIKGSKTIIMDPYRYLAFGGKIAYPKIEEFADIVTVSHDHDDHNAFDEIKGDPVIIKSEGLHIIENVKIQGFKTYHDSERGKKRGENIIFLINLDEIQFLHLGDLGEIPSQSIIEKVRNVDFMFIPVGGVYTIGPREAKEVVELIEPKIIIPMHYKTCNVDFELFDVNEFLKDEKDVRYVGKEIRIRKKPKKKEIWVFE